MTVVVTGSSGFIGKNLIAWLRQNPEMSVLPFDQQHELRELRDGLAVADVVVHLAGVNRPQTVDELCAGNVGLTSLICDQLLEGGRPVPLILSSSTQATLDNPYGVSKRQAEEVVAKYSQESGAPVEIFRLSNVFGKWCRPNYNSVVATFCYNLTHDLPLTVSDPRREVVLIHVDDVIRTILSEIREFASGAGGRRAEVRYRNVTPAYVVTLAELEALLRSFRESRQTLRVPDLGNALTLKLYGAYLSYLEPDNFAYDLAKKCDSWGCLAEFVKSPAFGQIFVSRTRPGVSRGNHFHHTKAEKFLVLDGEAIIRFRSLDVQVPKGPGQRPSDVGQDAEVIEYRVSGTDFRVVDIPPGYAHSIENVGKGELVTLFWASEVFDVARPDTEVMTVH